MIIFQFIIHNWFQLEIHHFMSIAIRNTLLVSTILLVSFPSFAEGGLASLGDAVERIFIVGSWLILSIVLLVIALIFYTEKKKPVFAILVYLSLTSLSILYYIVLSFFIKINGSLISDNHIDTMHKDKSIMQYWILMFIGVVLLNGIVIFIIYHVKTLKKQRAIYDE